MSASSKFSANSVCKVWALCKAVFEDTLFSSDTTSLSNDCMCWMAFTCIKADLHRFLAFAVLRNCSLKSFTPGARGLKLSVSKNGKWPSWIFAFNGRNTLSGRLCWKLRFNAFKSRGKASINLLKLHAEIPGGRKTAMFRSKVWMPCGKCVASARRLSSPSGQPFAERRNSFSPRGSTVARVVKHLSSICAQNGTDKLKQCNVHGMHGANAFKPAKSIWLHR
mmetsp:Transcript_4615/g.13907  ORF Transcript_4615/g.13907 Transcript_4615/m.13907 type:complete len:222 (+) Transcript_4615:1069-1734(+)